MSNIIGYGGNISGHDLFAFIGHVLGIIFIGHNIFSIGHVHNTTFGYTLGMNSIYII